MMKNNAVCKHDFEKNPTRVRRGGDEFAHGLVPLHVAMALFVLLFVKAAVGAPTTTPWQVDGPDDSVACAAAALSGWYAIGDSFEDSVELRDIRGALQHTITRAQIGSLLPWMSLDGGTDGPCGLAFTDSGRWLFVLVFDDTTPGDGQPSDAVLRYDTSTGVLSVYVRTELADTAGAFPHLSAAFHEGKLYIGTGSGEVIQLSAGRNDAAGSVQATVPLGGTVVGLTIDRDHPYLYAATATTVFRADLNSSPLAFTSVGAISDIRALAYSSHYGHLQAGQGLYVLSDDGTGERHIWQLAPLAAQGTLPFTPFDYTQPAAETHDLIATPCGRLLATQDEDAVVYADDADSRLGFEAWLSDEFLQVVTFAKGLISPDGEPDGWVIDADVPVGSARFHPATPDGACWTILLLMMNDEINGDPAAQERVRTILMRYAGQMPDGIGPGVSGDGMMRHWCDPFSTTGAAKPGWPDEWASLSTMKIVLAAARAMAYYPADAEIQSAGRAIIGRVTDRNGWDPYIQTGTDALYFKSAGTHPDLGSAGAAFHEGIIFVEQAAAYGSQASGEAYGRWLDRMRWPRATYITGQPITGNSWNNYQAAFLSLYPLLVMDDFRIIPRWQDQIENMRASFGAWTDENGPRYRTVFSAGTTKSQWGGYNADHLGWHPGNISTFPSLMAFGATGQTSDAVGAYHAYRRGGRQDWATGASMLYRRSDVDLGYLPNTGGLPDVALGALGLGELIQPGSVEGVLTGDYPDLCPVDLTGDGIVDAGDLGLFITLYLDGDLGVDFTSDGVIDAGDLGAFITMYLAGC